MAKRKKSGGGSAPTVRIVTAPAPRKRSAPRAARAASPKIIRVSAPVVKAPTRRRRSSGGARGLFGSVGGAIGSRPRTAIVIGAAALGFAHKEKWLEKLPVIGKAGPITSFGLIGWGAEEIAKIKLPPIVHDMVTASLAISAFNLGFSGGNQIVGDGYEGGAVFFE
jgi:hypothetical protein